MPARPNDSNFLRAAGGIVWRDSRRTELAVIYRDIHAAGECCLPKGKLEEGEGWERAAVREVKEETGCLARVWGFAGLLHYHVGSRPKVVVFFEMLAVEAGRFEPSPEVRDTGWLTPEAALAGLTHRSERDLLRECLAKVASSGQQ